MTFENARSGARPDDMQTSPVKVAIIGVGGGGSNAVDNMITAGVKVDQFMAINTDRQALRVSKAKKRVQIGSNITGGFGAGADPESGRKSAEECREPLTALIKDMDLVFITAGMGGGTGTGAAPVIAEIAHTMGKLVIAFVTTPFMFEGEPRMRNAMGGIARLREHVDSIIIVPNERLTSVAKDMTTQAAFKYADDILRQGVQATTDLIANPGRINVDFADIRAVLKNSGDAIMGIGRASGTNRALEAVKRAVNNAVLGTTIEGASRAIVNIEGKEIKMDEVNQAAALVKEICAKDANIIFGTAIVPTLQDEMQVTIIATGFVKPNGAGQPQQQSGLQPNRPQQSFGGMYGQGMPQQGMGMNNQNPYYRPQQTEYRSQPQPQPQQPNRAPGNGFIGLDDDTDSAWLNKLRNK